MDKQEIRASILRSVEQEIDAWLDVEPKITDAFDYEKTLFDRTMRIGRLMLENSRRKPPKNRNKKKRC